MKEKTLYEVGESIINMESSDPTWWTVMSVFAAGALFMTVLSLVLSEKYLWAFFAVLFAIPVAGIVFLYGSVWNDSKPTVEEETAAWMGDIENHLLKKYNVKSLKFNPVDESLDGAYVKKFLSCSYTTSCPDASVMLEEGKAEVFTYRVSFTPDKEKVELVKVNDQSPTPDEFLKTDK